LVLHRRKLGSRPASRASSEIVVLSYCSPMEIYRALQEPQDTKVGILTIATVVDASNCTPYYPDEIREVPLMDDRLASMLVFDVH
jgi:hypothetical protein